MSTSPGDGPDARTAPPSQWPAGAAIDPYQLLEVPLSASPDDLRRAFRRLSKLVHPDTTTLPAAQAQEAFLKLSQAYALLSDPLRRRAYDAQRSLGAGLSGATSTRGASASGPGVSRGAATGGAATGGAAVRIGTRPLPVRRALSGGEWFALVLLAIALVLSLVLGLGVAWARGTELVRQPSWWVQPPPVGEPGMAQPAVTETGAAMRGATAARPPSAPAPAPGQPARVAPPSTAPRLQETPPPTTPPTTLTARPTTTPTTTTTTTKSPPPTPSATPSTTTTPTTSATATRSTTTSSTTSSTTAAAAPALP